MRYLHRDSGSALVETIGMLALTALLSIGLIHVGLLVHQQNRLTHAAVLAARAGAIDPSTAESRVRNDLAGIDLDAESYNTTNIGGLCLFEVRLQRTVKTILGGRTVVGVAHALCEAF